MCRLLGYALAGYDASLNEVLEASLVDEFRHISLIHNDGWGASLIRDAKEQAHLEDGGAPRPEFYDNLYCSTQPARLDETFESVVQQPARSGLFHLRLASSNLPLCIENQQPFYAQGLAFTHNGDISDASGINLVNNPHLLVTEEEVAATGGKSDSAIYFAYILHFIHEGCTLPRAVAAAVQELRKTYPLSSYNCFVQSETELICVNAYGRNVTSDRIIEIYDKYNQGDKALDYRAIRYRELERGGVVVASSGFEQSKDNGWKELDKNHLLVASNVTGKYGIYSL